jgi:zinc transporter, ZIP family
MSTWETYLLGFIAGVTIFLGLPMARIRGLSLRIRAAMTATATGILIFLLWDVLTNGVEPVETALDDHNWTHFVPWCILLAVGFAIGLMSLVYYDWWLKCRRKSPMIGPGAAALEEFEHRVADRWTAAQRLSLLIATGIGLHNFGEGLAIGQSSAQDEVALAIVLIIGFALHNTTEGFGVTGPLAADDHHPSWGFLALLGVIGGGPTFIGTVIGYSWVSEALQVLFFSLAAGSILYVVMELINVCRRFSMPITTTWTIFLGIVLGFGTDFVLSAVGA